MSARLTASALALLVTLCTSGCAVIKVAPMIPEIVGSIERTHSIELKDTYDAIEAGKFEKAETRLRALERKATPTPLLTSEIAFIRALITERRGDTLAAVTQYRAITVVHPDTPDAYLAAKKVRLLLAKTTPAESPP